MDLKPSYDILIPGHYFCDLIFTGIPAFPSLGSEIYCGDLAVAPGGIMNTVIALSRLGVNVGWLGQVGDDFFSRYILERAEAGSKTPTEWSRPRSSGGAGSKTPEGRAGRTKGRAGRTKAAKGVGG